MKMLPTIGQGLNSGDVHHSTFFDASNGFGPHINLCHITPIPQHISTSKFHEISPPWSARADRKLGNTSHLVREGASLPAENYTDASGWFSAAWDENRRFSTHLSPVRGLIYRQLRRFCLFFILRRGTWKYLKFHGLR
jgi:hypothetical protein